MENIHNKKRQNDNKPTKVMVVSQQKHQCREMFKTCAFQNLISGRPLLQIVKTETCPPVLAKQ